MVAYLPERGETVVDVVDCLTFDGLKVVGHERHVMEQGFVRGKGNRRCNGSDTFDIQSA